MQDKDKVTRKHGNKQEKKTRCLVGAQYLAPLKKGTRQMTYCEFRIADCEVVIKKNENC